MVEYTARGGRKNELAGGGKYELPAEKTNWMRRKNELEAATTVDCVR
jgi:hypothetical protein